MSKARPLENASVVVTGGTMGIGRSVAEHCLAAGAKVIICSRTAADVKRTINELTPMGKIGGQVVDVTDERQVEALFATALEAHDGLDAVIHCAGVYGPIGLVSDLDPQAWWESLHTNLFGTFLVTRQACSHMRNHGGGRLVLFSGGGASGPFPRYSAYAASKVAVVRFCETLAEEMRPFDIEVNAIAPGFVVTRLHQDTLEAGEAAGEFLKKTKEEIAKGGVPAEKAARLAVFLASQRSCGITGKFVSAVWDGYETWPDHLEELSTTDIFTLRRILPKDRGMDWQ